jgi:hypothetical protein
MLNALTCRRPSSPAPTRRSNECAIPEFITHAKANPGKINLASNDTGRAHGRAPLELSPSGQVGTNGSPDRGCGQ